MHLFFCRSEAEQEDEVDSDFSIDENDELVSDNDEEQTKRKKGKGVFTKAYKVKECRYPYYTNKKKKIFISRNQSPIKSKFKNL